MLELLLKRCFCAGLNRVTKLAQKTAINNKI
nr:MAG TPA: hypothetical protein [Caudoviricetes sp.]